MEIRFVDHRLVKFLKCDKGVPKPIAKADKKGSGVFVELSYKLYILPFSCFLAL